MNILILSPSACYHHLAQLFLKEGNTVYHIGAPKSAVKTDRYFPIFRRSMDALNLDQAATSDEDTERLINYIKDKNINLVMAGGLTSASTKSLHQGLKELNIPYFFVSPEHTKLEKSKFTAKGLLEELGIPTGKGELINGKQLFETFKTVPRPFVVKINNLFLYGRQTIIVTDDNFEEVYDDLFSVQLGNDIKITNIQPHTSIVIEQLVNIKREYSYHMLVNEHGWKYLGSARDYKKYLDGDRGFNSSSMGAYDNWKDVDSRVHDYAEKIVNKVKGYTGFMFLGIAHNENDVPVILEINTRSGDPELPAILGSVTNNLSDLFLTAAQGNPIPDIFHNNKNTVAVRLVNRVYDWTKPASFLPVIGPQPSNIIHSIEGDDPFYIKHSIFTTSADTLEEAADTIYKYLDKQSVGQYRYRRDIGLLK
jgi:phosphoribosylamine--glycine ligase